MKKLLIYALVFGLAFTPTFGWASTVLFAGGQGQQVVYRGTVTGLRISAVDGTAFLDNLPSAVTDLVTASPGVYGVEVYDSSGRMLKGVLKAVGTGETVSETELVTDGGFENWDSTTELSSWTETLAGTSTLNREGTIKHGGSYSLRIDVDSSNSSSYPTQTITGSLSALYVASFWAYSATSGKTVKASYSNIESGVKDPGTSWTQYSWYVTKQSSNILSSIRGSASSTSIYFDDLSLKQVLTPSTSGITIVSAKGGTTYNWQFKHASFTYNQSTNYVILKKLR